MTSERGVHGAASAAALLAAWRAALAPDGGGLRGKQTKAAGGDRRGKEDYKASDMLERGLEFLGRNRKNAACKLIASVPRTVPQVQGALRGLPGAGQALHGEAQHDLAIKQFRRGGRGRARIEAAGRGPVPDRRLLLQPRQLRQGVRTLRKVANEYPWSVFANEAYYYIGLCHFKLSRWAKAVEALEMVGASVPATARNELLAEAGQRLS